MREMRESGLPGIGKIPYGFEVSRIKFIADIFGRIGFRGYTEQDFVDEGEGAITLSPSNLKNMKMTYDRCSYISWDKYRESPEIMIHDYDILMVKTGSTYGKSCLVENLPMEATINPQLLVYKNLKTDAKFFSYFLQTDYVSDLCELAVVGSTIPTMSQSKIGNFAVILPSKDVQVEISRHLDCCCAEIDDLAAVIQSQIDTLEQYKRSVITEAVTKGLNPDAEMRDSGIPWIGMTPSHWDVKRTKFLFEIVKRIAGKEGYDVLSVTQKGLKVKDLSDYSGQIAENYLGYQLVYPTDYVMNHMDLLTGWVDCSEAFGVTSPDYRVFRLLNQKEHDLAYFKYVFQCLYMNRIYYSFGNGVSGMGRWRLQTSTFLNFLLPVPPRAEQHRIAEFIGSKVSEIDNIIDVKKQQLETLDEYKKSLIFEYVTGKKKATMT